MGNETMKVKCPDCGHSFEMARPKRAGNHPVTCEKCGFEWTEQVIPRIIGKPSNDDDPITSIRTEMPRIPLLGKAIMAGQRYVIKEPAKVGNRYSYFCPKCNKSIAIRPKEPGEQGITCKFCNVKTYITVVTAAPVVKKVEPRPIARPIPEPIAKPEPIYKPEPQPVYEPEPSPVYEPEPQPVYKPEPIVEPRPVPEPSNDVRQIHNDVEVFIIELPSAPRQPVYTPTPTPLYTPPSEPQQVLRPTNARLRWGVKNNKQEVILMDGSTVIGRTDPEFPSDIEFADSEMSRQSVRIDAAQSGGLATFTLTVQKSTNPVFVNGRRLPTGGSAILTNGSTIHLGRTTLVFRTD